jgi:hypothetical protein
MKKLKLYSLALVLLAGFSFVSCSDDNNDTLSGDETVGGLINSASSAITYALTSSPTFVHNAKVTIFQGAVKTSSVEVYKQYTNLAGVKSENVLLKTLTFATTEQMESANFTFTYNELIAGLTVNGVAMPASDADLSAGEFWTLTYVSTTSEGKKHLNTKTTKVNVACVSDLAGNYSTSTSRVGTTTIYTFASETFDLVGDGQYNTSYVGPYYGSGQTPASSGNGVLLAPASDAGYTFTDICNNMQMETQNLASIYSNEVRQTAAQRALSFRNPTTGVIVIHYSVWFTGNTVERPFISTYTPLP